MIHILMVIKKSMKIEKPKKRLQWRVRVELIGTAWSINWTNITDLTLDHNRKYTVYARPPNHLLRPFMTLLVKFYISDEYSCDNETAFHEWKIDHQSKFTIMYLRVLFLVSMMCF